MGVPSADYAGLFRALAVVGVLNAAIGGWYYLRILAVMYLRNPVKPPQPQRRWPALVALGVCAVLTVGLSIPPGARWLSDATRQASGMKVAAER
jgi:NADH-quinone oxidoreductase subunit N